MLPIGDQASFCDRQKLSKGEEGGKSHPNQKHRTLERISPPSAGEERMIRKLGKEQIRESCFRFEFPNQTEFPREMK